MNKILATAILALVLAPASQAQAPHSNLAISALPQNTASLPVVTKTKRSTPRVLKADDAAALVSAAKLFPKNSFERAAYLIKVGKPLLALPELDKVIKANPNSVEAYLSKAKIFNDLHRLDEAQVCLRKALAIQPDYQPARILLATVAIQKGDLDGAMKELGQSFGFALATKAGATSEPKPNEVKGGLLAPIAEFPGAWILQSLHMMIMPAPSAVAQNTTLNSDQTFESAAVAPEPIAPEAPPKLTALKPIEDKQEEIIHVPPQKSTLVFTREADQKPIDLEPPKPEKKNPLKFLSDAEDSTFESAEVPAEKPIAIAKALPVVTPVIPPPPPAIEEPKPAPLQYDPGNLEKSPLGFVASASSLPPANVGSATAPKIELSPPDQWTEKLKYLSEHGTAELADGEAFMFAEDTGEATLFLADGKKIRRVIAVPRDNDVVVATRRPELLKAEDLVYRLALLAKLMPSAAPQASPKAESESPTKIAAAPKTPSTFNADSVLARNDGFVGWLKHLFPF